MKLKTSKPFRESEKKAIVFGSKIIAELSNFGIVDTLLETYLHSTSAKAHHTYIVTEDIIKKISGMPSPEPVAAVVHMPEERDLSDLDYLLILDGVSDPGNLGTLLRTALALGWQGVFLLGSCCDPFNDKALRAAKGATFLLPLQSGSLEDLRALLQKRQRSVYIADIQGQDFKEADIAPPIALTLGSESHGPSKELKELFPAISIPMRGPMESLNVAIAASILMQRLRG